MPETIETPTEDTLSADAEASFNAAIGKEPEAEPVVTEKESEKPNQGADTSGDIPEHILTGEKPEEKKPEESEIDKVLAQDEPTRGKGQWKLVKEHALTLKQKLAETTKELENLRTNAPKVDRDAIEAELKELREKVSQTDSILEKKAFEESPRYKKMLAREEGYLKAAKGYLDGGDVDASIIDIAARQKGQQRLKTLEDAGLSTAAIAAISSTLANVDIAAEERSAVVANYKEEMQREAAAEKLRSEQEALQERELHSVAFKKVSSELAAALVPLQKVNGADAWNAQVDTTIDAAKKAFEADHSPEDFAKVALKAAAYDVQEKITKTLRDQNKTLRAELQKLKAQQPGVNGTRKDGQPAYDPENPPSLEQRAMADFDSAMAGRG